MRRFPRWYQSLLFNPRTRIWVILGTVLYVISPFDLSPDLLPALGQLDDVVLLALLGSGLLNLVRTRFFSNSEDAEAPDSSKESQGKTPQDEATKTIDVNAVSVDDA